MADLRTDYTDTSTGLPAALNAVDARVNAIGGQLALALADRNPPVDGVASASAAMSTLYADSRAGARYIISDRRDGLPSIDLPVGNFHLTTTVLRELDRGAVIRGRGKRATVLYIDSGITMFDLHRVSQLKLADVTLVCGSGVNPGITPWVDGLIENSCAVHIRERSDDTISGVSTTDLVFEDVQFIGFHRAIRSSGNQMGDNVSFVNCDWIDNFYDFDLGNGQAMNWRVYGGEFLCAVNTAEVSYNARIAGWSSASVPLTAPAGQRRDPSDGASVTQNVTMRDGAVVRAVAGGAVLFQGTSFIGRKTRLLFGGLDTNAATAQANNGTNVNLMPWTFDHCSSEIRQTLTPAGVAVADTGDTWGYDRRGLIRYERPHPVVGDATLRAVVRFHGERATVQTSVALIYVSNGVQIEWVNGCRAFRQNSTAEPAVVPSVTTLITGSGSTLGNLGKFVSRDSTLLYRNKAGRLPTGAAFTPPADLDHLVVVDGSLPSAWNFDIPVQHHDRTLVNGVPVARMVMPVHSSDSTIPTATRRVYGPKGMRLLRVSAISDQPATHASIVLEFRDSAATVLAALTVTWGSTGTLTLTSDGQKCDAARKPWADVNQRVADGIIDVVPTTAVANVFGQILLEYV